jgi:hypothetical protein
MEVTVVLTIPAALKATADNLVSKRNKDLGPDEPRVTRSQVLAQALAWGLNNSDKFELNNAE